MNLKIDNIAFSNNSLSKLIGKASFHSNRLKIFNHNPVVMQDTSYLFRHCCNDGILDVSDLKITGVCNTSHMFSYIQCKIIASNMDLSGMADLRNIFTNCESRYIEMNNLIANNSADTVCMFEGCEYLKKADLSGSKLYSCASMIRMFNGCSNLEEVNMVGIEAKNVTSFMHMFFQCTHLKKVDLSSINTSKVQDVSAMFYLCRCLESLDLKNFGLENVEYMMHMFRGCCRLRELDISGFKFNRKHKIDTKNMFMDCDSLERVVMPKDDYSRSIILAQLEKDGIQCETV